MRPSTFFAERLGTLRTEAGLSQYALAKRSGLSKQAVSNLEMGEREPNWTTVQRLSAALGVDCTEFVDPAVTDGIETDLPPRPRGRPAKPKPAQLPTKRTRGRSRKGD